MTISTIRTVNPSLLSFKNEVNHISTISNVLKPKPLKAGDGIGIFTPSWPANVHLRGKYLHALKQIEKAGFQPYEGTLTKKLSSNGYRSSDPKERAEEFMELLCQPNVKCLMATIGGWNSSSLIPFLDFKEIRNQRKIVCGYSDITSLQMAILKYSNLVSIYGPSLVPIFGEYPSILPYSLQSFVNMTSGNPVDKKMIHPPIDYSKQFIDAMNEGWQQAETQRQYQKNEGWQILAEGRSSGQLIVANLETLLALAGTPVFPDLKNKILVLEEEEARYSIQERAFTQMLLMGIFDKICGLMISKPFTLSNEEASFSYEELLLEIIGKRHYPIVTNFDCGHTFPSMSLPIGVNATLEAFEKTGVSFCLDENVVTD